MMPPLVRRCPDCGHVGLWVRFTAVEGDDGDRVACPACDHRFETGEDRWLL